MLEIITAVYENGVLRPLEPVSLVEHQTVRLRVIPEQTDENKEVIQLLINAGMISSILEQDLPPPPDPVSVEERQRLADALGKAPGPPLSELILQERGER